MEEYDGLAIGIAGLLVIEGVSVPDVEMTGVVSVDGRIECASIRVFIHARIMGGRYT
jgi:hypothetical protein